MRAQPSQQRSRRTVRALLHAANDEFTEHGYDAAQMTRIAARADVSVGSMYRFFPDKDSFARALVDRYGQEMVVDFRAVLTDFLETGDVGGAVAGLVRAAARQQAQHGAFYRLADTVLEGEEDDVGASVRTLLIDTVITHMESAGMLDGSTPDERARREEDARFAVDFIMGTCRTGLTLLPEDGEERRIALRELERMLVLYAVDRFGPTT